MTIPMAGDPVIIKQTGEVRKLRGFNISRTDDDHFVVLSANEDGSGADYVCAASSVEPFSGKGGKPSPSSLGLRTGTHVRQQYHGLTLYGTITSIGGFAVDVLWAGKTNPEVVDHYETLEVMPSNCTTAPVSWPNLRRGDSVEIQQKSIYGIFDGPVGDTSGRVFITVNGITGMYQPEDIRPVVTPKPRQRIDVQYHEFFEKYGLYIWFDRYSNNPQTNGWGISSSKANYDTKGNPSTDSPRTLAGSYGQALCAARWVVERENPDIEVVVVPDVQPAGTLTRQQLAENHKIVIGVYSHKPRRWCVDDSALQCIDGNGRASSGLYTPDSCRFASYQEVLCAAQLYHMRKSFKI